MFFNPNFKDKIQGYSLLNYIYAINIILNQFETKEKLKEEIITFNKHQEKINYQTIFPVKNICIIF